MWNSMNHDRQELILRLQQPFLFQFLRRARAHDGARAFAFRLLFGFAFVVQILQATATKLPARYKLVNSLEKY
jgi:hypothetical protein